MGEVYRAEDSKLGREVALKVLPEAVSADADRLARFDREARVLASLNHPAIASVYSVEHEDSLHFLVMELAAGEDLAQRIARGPIPLDEALAIARQIADALEFAHENGIVHRDLKPANVMLGADGTVKVLDFGLAKAIAPLSGEGSLSPTMSPTVTSTGTLAGTILGTAAYMSPEQAKGRSVDRRADVWAFGCVLLEMLTGRLTFAGDSIAETLASVMKEEPDWDSLPSGTPPRIVRLLRRCLVKDPRGRFRDAGDARIVLDEVMAGDEGDAGIAATPAPAPFWQRALPWGLSLLLAVALVATRFASGTGGSSAASSVATLDLAIVLADDEIATLASYDYEVMPNFAVPPAGDRVVYTTSEGGRKLIVRKLASSSTEALRGTEGASGPFFSQDGNWIGFFADNALVKVPAGGGARITIAEDVGIANGASWGRDDTIVFAQSYVGPLWTVSAGGGEAQPLTALKENERSHRYPQILPDGKSVLFTIKPAGILTFDDGQIAVADLATGEHQVLAERGTYARYVRTGHLVIAREGALLAAPFDLDELRTRGGAVPVLDNVFSNPITGAALFEFADNGTCVAVRGDYGTGPTTLIAIDRESGKRTPLAVGSQAVAPRLSPDGKRLLLHGAAANDQVLMLDLERGTVTRLTEASYNNVLPIWGPKGERVVFGNDRTGTHELAWMTTDGRGIETLTLTPGTISAPTDWSPDGSTLAFEVGIGALRDIRLLDMQTRESRPFIETRADEGDAVFSPDGRWLVYTSDESGRRELYATAFPGPGLKLQLTTAGGELPRWSADGEELLYKAGRTLVASPVTWRDGPQLGPPKLVAELRSTIGVGWDLTEDGRTIYVGDFDEKRWETSRFDVLFNWDLGGR